MVSLTIHWTTNDRNVIAKIRQRFGITKGMTVNWKTDTEVKEEDIPLLEETARRGFIRLQYK